MANRSAEETTVGVFVDHAEGGGQRGCFWAGLVAMPFEVGSFPENTPDPLGAHKSHLGDGFLDVLTGTIIRRAHEEKFDGLIREALVFADPVAQMQGRTAARPEGVFEHFHVLGDFEFSEGHSMRGKTSA